MVLRLRACGGGGLTAAVPLTGHQGTVLPKKPSSDCLGNDKKSIAVTHFLAPYPAALWRRAGRCVTINTQDTKDTKKYEEPQKSPE